MYAHFAYHRAMRANTHDTDFLSGIDATRKNFVEDLAMELCEYLSLFYLVYLVTYMYIHVLTYMNT